MPLPPQLRAILLGASNLHRGLPSLIGALARTAGPIEGWAATGHGRSYGVASRFGWVRGLPGIIASPLWREVGGRPPLPCVGLITDIGNDLVYGAPVDSILSWVEACVDRLAVLRARTVLTLLPLPRLERLTPAQFQLFRALSYPGRRASWAGTLQRARALDAHLRALAETRGLATLVPPLEWYGLDPIHLRRHAFPAAWSAVLHLWDLPEVDTALAAPYRGKRVSAETRILAWPLRWPQPALRFRDGSSLSLH